MSDRLLLLSSRVVQQKIKRIALEIIEKNFGEKIIYICGINIRGDQMARMIIHELNHINHSSDIKYIRLQLNLENLLETKIKMDEAETKLKNQVIVVVDDVGNTGKTLQFAIRPLLSLKPKKIQLAVLVDRKHKAYPVCADFVGFSLSTTMKEHIEVEFKKKNKVSVFLT